MSYDTYRPDWDPFFSESWTPKPLNPRPNWGDRSADPKASRRFNISDSAPESVPKDDVPK